ncbi:50S ribosomal protein L29 [Patescibacteria group bacterium]|nr:50S ribosomal protein L29 [Patescibacteria group bacterium]
MNELTAKKPEELHKLLAEKQEALRQFRFSAAGAQTRNTKEGRALRTDIARIHTILNQRTASETPQTA